MFRVRIYAGGQDRGRLLQFRNKVGLDVALEALRRRLAGPAVHDGRVGTPPHLPDDNVMRPIWSRWA